MRMERARFVALRLARLAGARARWLREGARRHQLRLLAAAVALGILFMVIHWG